MAGAAAGTKGIWLVIGLVVTVTLLAVGVSLALHGWPRGVDGGSGGPSSTPLTDPSPAAPTLIHVVGDARGIPDAAAVAALLQRHFEAINHRDYAAWKATVTARRVNAITPEHWQTDYRSTTDAQVVVSHITPSSSGEVVDLTFVSTQDLRDAPPDLRVTTICWSSRWPVVAGLLDVPAAGATTKQAC